jgi:pimeloyl-ACP methyl ester carboxylesterase
MRILKMSLACNLSKTKGKNMPNKSKYWIIFLCIIFTVMSACSTTPQEDIDKLVDIGDYSLHIACRGEGSPTVVIDSGLGDTSARWQEFQDQVAEFGRVCTYDRAGYGTSEPGTLPRDSQRVADELKLLLDKAGEKAPYLLVGHSLGGLNAQVFAEKNPKLVAGMLLLDPPPLDFITGQAFPDLLDLLMSQTVDMKNLAEFARKSTDPEAQASADFMEALASENASLVAESATSASAIDSFGDIPLVVIASGQANPGFGVQAEAFQKFWNEQSEALAGKSASGSFLLSPESSHYLQVDDPGLIIDALRQMLADLR